MIGKLDVEENVMDDDLPRARKAAAIMKTVSGDLSEVIATLGWDCYDDVVVEIGGTVVSGIHQGEDYNKKWATPYGVRKYNKDAFIVISNNSRRDLTKSQPNPDLVAHHGRLQPTESKGTDVSSDQTDSDGTTTGQREDNP